MMIFTLPFEILRTFATLLSNRRYRNPLIMPYLIGALSFLIFLSLALSFREVLLSPIPEISLDWTPSFIRSSVHLLVDGVRILGTAILVVIVATLGSLFSMVIVGGFFLEVLIERYLSDTIAYRTPEEKHALFDMRRILKDLLSEVAMLLLIAGTFLVMLITSVFPPLSLLALLIGAFLLGIELAEGALSLLYPNITQRLKAVSRNRWFLLQLGLVFSVLLSIPFAGLLLYPAGSVVAAQRLGAEVKDATKLNEVAAL